MFTGERGRGETFAIFVARKELQKQELESQIGEAFSPLVAGRILIRQANLTDLQKEVISLKSQVLRSVDEIANSLRSLDRLEALSSPMVPMASSGNTARAYAVAGEYEEEDNWQDGERVGEGHQREADDFEQYDERAEPSTGSNEIRFEDREHDEAEAIYVQPYNDVRKDLRTRRKERGFIHRTASKRKGKSKGSGKSQGEKGKKSKRDRDGDGENSIKGGEAELLARARCFRCNELGRISKQCPLARKQSFVQGKGTPRHGLCLRQARRQHADGERHMSSCLCRRSAPRVCGGGGYCSRGRHHGRHCVSTR